MAKRTFQMLSAYIHKHYKILTIIHACLWIGLVYVVMINLSYNHLSFTHLMYIPIVITGIVLGSSFGMGIAVIAGLVVGPIMPYNLSTGQPQFWGDWLFRLLMMTSIGLLSGLFSMNYRKALIKIKELSLMHQDTGLYNINYLNQQSLIAQKAYTFATLIIGNAEAIRDVLGHMTYVKYLKHIESVFMATFEDLIMIQVDIDQLWLVLATQDFDVEVSKCLEIMHHERKVDGESLFIDYALGFSQRRHIFEKNLSNYFIQSDIAAKEAKSKNLTHLTFKDLSTNKQYEYELLTDFEAALNSGEIYLMYQPKIDLKTKRPVGLEALIRWDHKEKKTIYPDQFISAVEKTNLIHEMTQKVFMWSLKFQMELQSKNIHLPISINISTKNLYDEKFYEKMIIIFKNYPIKPHLVEFEITESLLMEDPENSKRMLEALSNYGFKIAIDDFGKGYSSLAYLAQFPINTIKIDRFFTKQVLINPTTQHIVKATIDLAKQLGYEVLIEGVEDQETSDLLEKIGCHTAQGYLYLRPRKEQDIISYLMPYRTK